MAIKVKLNHAGREYLHYPVSNLPPNFTETMQIRFPPATIWETMEWVIQNQTTKIWSVWDTITGLPTHARILIAGPNVGNAGGVVLPIGDGTTPEFRFINNPEVIIRPSPVVIVIVGS